MQSRFAPRIWTLTAATAIVIGTFVAAPAGACPNCKDAVAQSGATAEPGNTAASIQPAGRLGEGFNYSILLMLAVPYALVGGAGWLIYRSVRKAEAARTPAEPGVPGVPGATE